MTDVIVIGGGLSGLLAARELERGGARVTLLERGEIGREASWAGGGILSPLYAWRYPDPVNRLAAWSQQAYPALARELAAATGIDPEWTSSGLLVLDPEDAAGAQVWAERWSSKYQQVDAETCLEIEPALGKGENGLWCPELAQVRNPRLLQALVADLKSKISLREREPVTRLTVSDGRVEGVETASDRYRTGTVLVASGAWSAQLMQEIHAVPDIFPVRGQMLMYRAQPQTLRRIVLAAGRYLIPRRDGRIIVGSTVEYAGFEKVTTEAARELLARFAQECVPALAGFPVERQWAGLRPGSPEGLPLICEHPRVGGLFVNAGHFRNGVVMGPAAARLVADLILGRTPAIDPKPYKFRKKYAPIH